MTVATLKDYEAGKVGEVKRWLDEIDVAEEWQREWEEKSAEIIRRYEGQLGEYAASSFNILHSNTETLRPRLYGNVPAPDVRRRVKAPGQADREAAEVIERSLRYMNDTAPYSGEVNSFLSDLLLTGRGVLRVRYTPTIVKRKEALTLVQIDEQDRFFTANDNEVDAENVITIEEQPFVELEELHFERADVEHVPYCDFRHTPAKRWQDVRWIAFRHEFTKAELDDAFTKAVADQTELTIKVAGKGYQRGPGETQPDIFEKAEVWEIWDKTERQIIFVSPGNGVSPLATFDDSDEYYNLHDFFCTVEPLRTITTPSTFLPIPEFVIYQDLADELDEVTAKIRGIVETIELRGAYDGALPELGQIFRSRERLIPIPDWRALTDKGGLSGVMDFVPIDAAVKAFVSLVEQRNLLLNTIYQTVGLSDLTRGQSDPRETATAQRLKGQFGATRLTPRQTGVQEYLRDLMRIQAELIAEKFETQTLSLMTGMDIAPEVEMLLRIDPLRGFAVDIETDSTSAPDQARDREQISEVLQGLSEFGKAAQHLPEGARMPLLTSIARKFKLGRDVELALEEAAEQPPAPDPEAIAKQEESAVKKGELQLKAQDSERDFMIDMQKLAQSARELGLKEDEAESRVLLELGKLFGNGQRMN